MREVAAELNEYDEEVQKVVGIFAPHLGADHVYKTRETKWRIVSKAVDVDFLTLKSALGAPRVLSITVGRGSTVTAKKRRLQRLSMPQQ